MVALTLFPDMGKMPVKFRAGTYPLTHPNQPPYQSDRISLSHFTITKIESTDILSLYAIS
ncbi:hypothetical protein [Coleofasciculus chthonoplastes]|nr:hypothetical protein [Coleofasciculus chthonoplastes]